MVNQDGFVRKAVNAKPPVTLCSKTLSLLPVASHTILVPLSTGTCMFLFRFKGVKGGNLDIVHIEFLLTYA